MHTISIPRPGGEIAVNYNSDWSGDVLISWPRPIGGRNEVRVPGVRVLSGNMPDGLPASIAGPVVAACVRRHLVSRIIAAAEDL